jgi:hypothetical protein
MMELPAALQGVFTSHTQGSGSSSRQRDLAVAVLITQLLAIALATTGEHVAPHTSCSCCYAPHLASVAHACM